MGPFKFEFAPSSSSGSNKGDSPALLLSDNPYAWNKAANMIYLDSPAGVGLSYSTKPSDYATGMRRVVPAVLCVRQTSGRHETLGDVRLGACSKSGSSGSQSRGLACCLRP